MSEPEIKFEIDERGRIGYRVTNEGVLLSKDEKELIIDHVTRMQEENAKLRLLVEAMGVYERMDTDADPLRALEIRDAIKQLAGELGVGVDDAG